MRWEKVKKGVLLYLLIQLLTMALFIWFASSSELVTSVPDMLLFTVYYDFFMIFIVFSRVFFV